MIDETMFEAEEKMEKAVSVLHDDLATIRTGRATPQMFAKIVADYYGTPTPVNQLASMTVPEPRMATVELDIDRLMPRTGSRPVAHPPLTRSIDWSSSSFRSTMPFLPNDGTGMPVFASSASIW